MPTPAAACFISPDALLVHWQGHRRLTRRVIEAFPEDQLYTFSIGSMRSFGALALEMLVMATPSVRGVVTQKWAEFETSRAERPKQEVLRLWDDATEEINTLLAADSARATSARR